TAGELSRQFLARIADPQGHRAGPGLHSFRIFRAALCPAHADARGSQRHCLSLERAGVFVARRVRRVRAAAPDEAGLRTAEEFFRLLRSAAAAGRLSGARAATPDAL